MTIHCGCARGMGSATAGKLHTSSQPQLARERETSTETTGEVSSNTKLKAVLTEFAQILVLLHAWQIS